MHKQLQSYIAVLAMFLLWSCSSEQHYSVEADLEKDRKALHVELTLMDETQQQIRSRASEAGQGVLNENALKTFVGFLFDKNSKTCLGVIPSVYISLDKSQATIQLENELADQIEGQNVLLTLVANSQISDWSEVKHYNDLARISQEDRFNQGQSPELFLMTATIETGKVVWKAPELALHSIAQTVKLERAAAKIRAQVEEINIKEGNITYELVGKPQIQLVNYRSKSTILKAKSTPGFEPATSEFFPLEEVSVEGKRLLTTTEPFYSYEIDWSASQNSTNPYDSEMEAYLLLKLNLKVNDLETKPYYYRIPVNYSYPTKDMSAAQLAGLHKLQRNHLYHISTKVNSLGSEQADTPLELESKIAVRPYNRVSNIDGEIYRFDYLLLKEDHVVMPAITNRLIEYESSAKVEVVIDKIQYEQYSTMGQKTDVVITDAQKIANKKISAKIVSQDEIIGGVSIKKDYIRVYSPGPTNNVPLIST